MLARNAWGPFLTQFEWTHTIHLTTRVPYGTTALARHFTDRFTRRIAQKVQRPVPYFYSIEVLDDVPHLHALIGHTADLYVRRIQRCWEYGWSRVVRYKGESHAAYVAKWVTKPEAEYGLSKRFPRRVTEPIPRRMPNSYSERLYERNSMFCAESGSSAQMPMT